MRLLRDEYKGQKSPTMQSDSSLSDDEQCSFGLLLHLKFFEFGHESSDNLVPTSFTVLKPTNPFQAWSKLEGVKASGVIGGRLGKAIANCIGGFPSFGPAINLVVASASNELWNAL